MPALLTRMSTFSPQLTTCCTAASTCSRERWSQVTARALPPSFSIAATHSSSGSCLRPVTATAAPAPASAWA